MPQSCYICTSKMSKVDQISLHKFPENAFTRAEWIKACNLFPSDKLNNIFVCSKHFLETDYNIKNGNRKRWYLKADAVPSVNVPNKIYMNATPNNLKPEQTYLNQTPVESNKIQIIESLPVKIDLDSNNVGPISNIAVAHFEDIETIDVSEEIERHATLAGLGVANENSQESIEYGEKNDDTTSNKKRRVFQPRFISEITLEDLSNPRSAKVCLNLVRETDKKKTQLINDLRTQNRKLFRRISNLENTVSQLKKNNISFSKSGDNKMNNEAINFEDSKSYKINGEFTPEIRSFAQILYLYSTDAYTFVRKHFQSLPNPSTIRAWRHAAKHLNDLNENP